MQAILIWVIHISYGILLGQEVAFLYRYRLCSAKFILEGIELIYLNMTLKYNVIHKRLNSLNEIICLILL